MSQNLLESKKEEEKNNKINSKFESGTIDNKRNCLSNLNSDKKVLENEKNYYDLNSLISPGQAKINKDLLNSADKS
jgi:hypothetical protein